MIDTERATERTILRLELTLEARDETIRELRARISQLEARAEDRSDRLTAELLEAVKSRPAGMAAPVSGPHAAAQAAAQGVSIGPKAQLAISRVAGRNRALGQHLMEAATDALLADPDMKDEELAAKIIDGESPDLDSGDEDVEVARGRVIPGGAE